MAGIFGYLGKTVKDSALDRMSSAISAHDIDKIKLWRDIGLNFGIGQAALDIPGHHYNAFHDTPSGWHAVMHGALTNRAEIIKFLNINNHASDAELSLKLFLEEGGKSFLRLNGTYVLAFLHESDNCLHVVTDRHGSRPVFYAHSNGVLYFASRLSAFREIMADKGLDLAALAQLMAYGMVWDDRTLVEQIRKLPPASILTVKNNKVNIHTYWQWEKTQFASRKNSFHLERLADTFEAAGRRNLTPDVRYGLPLTGGLDSRALLALVHYLGIKDKAVKATLFSFAHNPKATDCVIAEILAHETGLPYKFLQISENNIADRGAMVVEMTDGLFNIIDAHGIEFIYDYPAWCDIMLAGMGGEFARSHYADLAWKLNDHELDQLNDRNKLASLCINKFNYVFDIENEFPLLFRGQDLHDIQDIARQAIIDAVESFPEEAGSRDKLDLVYMTKRMVNFQLGGRGHDEVSTETRYIYLDNEYAQAVYDAPYSLKRDGGIQRWLIEHFSPKLGRIIRDRSGMPMNMGENEEKLRRKTRMFLEKTGIKHPYRVIPYVNYAVLLRGPLKKYFQEILFNGALEDCGIINRAGLEKTWKEHMADGKWKQEQIGVLATVELFYKWFFK